jgi:acyl transferase domain-containing protein/acyl carrier protein
VSTLQRGRTAHPARGAVVCSDAAEATRVLESGVALPTGVPLSGEAPDVVFAFPGQGAQFPRMAAGLYGRQRVFTETIDECLDGLARHGLDLWPVWLADDPGVGLDETATAQPLLFAIEYALARQWMAWGITPAAVLGHSVGELVAAAVAGVCTVDDALGLVVARGRAMQAQPRGGMLVAAAAPEHVLASSIPGVVVAAVNAADQTVLAGPVGELETVAASLNAAGIATRPLRTSHAFHSPAMAEAVDEFAAAFAGVALSVPTVPMYSSATGKLLSAAEAADPAFWARQLAEPVLFVNAVDTVTAELGGGVVLEVGPGTALSTVLRRHSSVAQDWWRVVATLPRPKGAAQSHPEADAATDEREVLRALGELWMAGCPVNWTDIYRDENPQRVSLPGYRFQRRRFWIDPVTETTEAADAAAERKESGPFRVPVWVEASPLEAPVAEPGRTALALLPVHPQEALSLRTALEAAGLDVCPVEGGEDPGAVVERLEGAGRIPSVLVHASAAGAPTTGDPADELDRVFAELLELLQRAGRRTVRGRLPSLLVLTRGAVDVSGGEPVEPARAALVAAAKTAALETPEMDCRVIDLGGRRTFDTLVTELRAGTDPVVALRGRRRWLAELRPWTGTPAGETPLRPQGVYVITGGLGGLGLAVAKGLAETGKQPRIALLGRTARDVSGEIADLEALGARVETYQCDVADRARLAQVLEEVVTILGPVRGVFHLAGVAGDGMLQFRRREDAEHVLRPKVRGTLALADVLDGHPPVDFVVCFSSRAALTGMVGGGDYAAANAFLDGWAAGRPGWLSVDWPGWAAVGMARGGVLDKLSAAVRAARPSEVPVREDGLHHETVLSPATHWALDEHRVGGAAVLPGTGIVDLILRAYQATVPEASAPVTLRDVVFLRPLAGEAPRRTRVCFDAGAGGDWHVRVVSQVDGAPVDWQEHATAVLEAASGPAPGPGQEDLTVGLTEVPPPSMLPSPNDAFVFGPRWHNVERLWESGAVTVAELALAPAFTGETADHAVHPALLDTGAGLARRHRPGELMVPFTYRSMTWYAPLPARVRSRLTSRPGNDPVADVEFFAHDGTVVVTIDGLRMRPAKVTDFAGRANTAAESGLPPGEGVRLLLSLLSTSTPPQLVVSCGEPDAGPVEEVRNGHDPVSPGSVQERLAEMWRHILGRPFVAPEDDFFDLGGDSLMAVALTGRIRDAFGVQLSIGSLFDYPTLGRLAAALREQGAA